MNILSIAASVRQALQASAFRIEPPSAGVATVEAVRDLAAAVAAAASQKAGSTGRDASVKVLCDLATGVWRLKRRMLEPGSDRPKEAFRREFSHVESLQEVLAEAGLEIQDHTGQVINPGMSLRELDRIPTPGVSRDRVQQTVMPTLYFNGEHVQRGEVIVEVPPV